MDLQPYLAPRSTVQSRTGPSQGDLTNITYTNENRDKEKGRTP